MSAFMNSPYSPEDFDVLRNALDSWCAEKRVDIKSPEAQFAASAALDFFQAGHNDTEKLLSALRGHKAL
jgi:hypothetical protein